eukprot:7807742-Pyramimonas_sp.AAC.2
MEAVQVEIQNMQRTARQRAEKIKKAHAELAELADQLAHLAEPEDTTEDRVRGPPGPRPSAHAPDSSPDSRAATLTGAPSPPFASLRAPGRRSLSLVSHACSFLVSFRLRRARFARAGASARHLAVQPVDGLPRGTLPHDRSG